MLHGDTSTKSGGPTRCRWPCCAGLVAPGPRAQQTSRSGVGVREADLSVALLACHGPGPRFSTISGDVASDGVITSCCPKASRMRGGFGMRAAACHCQDCQGVSGPATRSRGRGRGAFQQTQVLRRTFGMWSVTDTQTKEMRNLRRVRTIAQARPSSDRDPSVAHMTRCRRRDSRTRLYQDAERIADEEKQSRQPRFSSRDPMCSGR